MPYRGYGRDRYVRHYDDEDLFDRESSRGRDYDYDYGRGTYEREDRYGRDRRESRGLLQRAGDEVRSWLGGEDAERRSRTGRADRYDREDYDDYGRKRYSELYPRSRRYDREDYSGGRDESRYTQTGYSGYDPNYPSLYGEGESMSDRERATSRTHRGLGPRGYRRSDQRIWEDINERLTEDDQIDASNVEVDVSQGDVTLSGMVSSRWEKRRIEDIADSVSGVRDVINQLRTRRSGRRDREEQTGRNLLDVGNDVKGKTVLRSRTGEKLGEVTDVIVHPIQGTVLGLLLRGPEGQERALVAQDFVIGNDAVMASETASMDEENLRSALSEGVPASRNIVGASVVTEDGNLVGRISQVLFSMDTRRAVYRIAESKLKQLFGGGFYLAGDVVRAYSPDGGRIIVPVDTGDRFAAQSPDEALGRTGMDTGQATPVEEEVRETPTRTRSTTTRSR
ncbi:MAG TPA: BON domain-containing protein [Blastocatellia bacterium]|nr:BON domain-containing protein [Blastocatellia bacterium]